DIADAIINEKYGVMKTKGIELEIEGTMAGIESIAPIDICTIFANALDNAFEALSDIDFKYPVIEICVKKDKRLLLISFLNPCGKNLSGKGFLETTKKDTVDHGFGLENIRMTAEKYKGGIECRIIEKEDSTKMFSLEIMLLI
ncbi:MAG: ATP-binding protein, partial [Bacillota bacterium]